MRDGLTEWTRLSLFNIQVDPLVVTGCVCKELHLFLCDGDVVAVSQVLANMCFEIFVVFDDCGHAESLAIPDALMLTGLGVQQQCEDRNVKCTADD